MLEKVRRGSAADNLIITHISSFILFASRSILPGPLFSVPSVPINKFFSSSCITIYSHDEESGTLWAKSRDFFREISPSYTTATAIPMQYYNLNSIRLYPYKVASRTCRRDSDYGHGRRTC